MLLCDSFVVAKLAKLLVSLQLVLATVRTVKVWNITLVKHISISQTELAHELSFLSLLAFRILSNSKNAPFLAFSSNSPPFHRFSETVSVESLRLMVRLWLFSKELSPHLTTPPPSWGKTGPDIAVRPYREHLPKPRLLALKSSSTSQPKISGFFPRILPPGPYGNSSPRPRITPPPVPCSRASRSFKITGMATSKWLQIPAPACTPELECLAVCGTWWPGERPEASRWPHERKMKREGGGLAGSGVKFDSMCLLPELDLV